MEIAVAEGLFSVSWSDEKCVFSSHSGAINFLGGAGLFASRKHACSTVGARDAIESATGKSSCYWCLIAS